MSITIKNLFHKPESWSLNVCVSLDIIFQASIFKMSMVTDTINTKSIYSQAEIWENPICVELFKQWAFPLKYLKFISYIIFTMNWQRLNHTVDQRKGQSYSHIQVVGIKIVAAFLKGNLTICIKLQRLKVFDPIIPFLRNYPK